MGLAATAEEETAPLKLDAPAAYINVGLRLHARYVQYGNMTVPRNNMMVNRMDWNPKEDVTLFQALLVVLSYGEPDPKLQALLEEQLLLREQIVNENTQTVH
jgi:hypothetical protein